MGYICEHCCHSDDGTNIVEAMSIDASEKASGCGCNKKAEVEGD